MGNKQYPVLRRHSLPRGAICQLIGVRPVLVKTDSNFVIHRIHCKCSNRYCCLRLLLLLLLLLFVVFITDVDFIYDTNVDVLDEDDDDDDDDDGFVDDNNDNGDDDYDDFDNDDGHVGFLISQPFCISFCVARLATSSIRVKSLVCNDTVFYL